MESKVRRADSASAAQRAFGPRCGAGGPRYHARVHGAGTHRCQLQCAARPGIGTHGPSV